ncbi:MAG: VWA domain-containing protein [Theionarchaea archaeon]|nr:VWA domain-containing protein [Theionarchaea archaeon]
MKKGAERITAVLLIAVIIYSIMPVFSDMNSDPEDNRKWVPFSSSEPKEPEIEILEHKKSGTILEVNIHGMYEEEIEVHGQKFHFLTIPGCGWTYEIGKPQMPVIRDTIGIPHFAKVRASVLESSYSTYKGYNVYPFQPPETDSGEENEFVIDTGFYSQSLWYPREILEVGDFAVWRDIHVVGLQINPLIVNPATGELRVYDHITIEVEYIGGTVEAKSISPKFARMYKDVVLNYDYLSIKEEYLSSTRTSGLKYLVITDPALESSVQPLVDWHHQKGLETRVVTTAVAGTTCTTIKDYITTQYQLHSTLEYVLLVGDIDNLPWNSDWDGVPSDYWYGCVAGDDLYAELAVGRISATSSEEVTHQVNKILDYLKSPPVGDWVERVLLIAHEEEAPGKYQKCKEDIRGDFNTFATIDHLYGASSANGGDEATNVDVTNTINSHRGIVNYRGHGSEWEWYEWDFNGNSYTTTMARNLSNGDYTPVVFSIACDNAHLDYSNETLSEAFMKANDAAAAFLGASRPSYTTPNHDFDYQLFDAIYNENIYSIGWILNSANSWLINHYGADSYAMDNVRMFLWLGDPALDVWTGTPQSFSIWHPPMILVGNQNVTVIVRDKGGLPVQGATVCLMKDNEAYVVSTTDGIGRAVLNVNTATVGTMDVTVTKHNFIPYEGTITIIDTCIPVDLIFVIDVTGSMWDDIDAVKASATTIVETITSMTCDFRVGIVGYRDHPIPPYGSPSDVMFEDYAFSSDKTTIISNINSLNVYGGADWEEAVYDALLRAIDSTSIGGWRSGVKKILILMGDAPPHDPCPIYGYTALDVINAAFLADPAHIYGVSVGCNSTVLKAFKEISERTGGEVFCAPTANDVVDVLLNALGNAIFAEPQFPRPSQPSLPPPDYNEMMRPLARENINKAKVLQAEVNNLVEDMTSRGKELPDEIMDLIERAKTYLDMAEYFNVAGNFTAANYWAIQAQESLKEAIKALGDLDS